MARFRNHSYGKVCHRIELPRLERSTRPSHAPGPSLPFPVRRSPGPNADEGAGQPERRRRAISQRALESAVQRAVAERTREHARERALLEASHGREVDVLQRRVAKLAGQIEAQELQLLRRQRGEVETGLASVYREVQGLPEDASNFALKQELMAAIFKANLKLRKRVASIPPLAE